MPFKVLMCFLLRSSLVVPVLLAVCLPALRADDLSDISVHGSASLSESYSDKYNFYGDTSDKFDNNGRELTVNASHRWSDGLLLTTQIYASDIDGLSKLELDFASLDYAVNPWFGVRLGRNKITIGLYGDTQDLDQVRTFANLPLGLYPRNLRPTNTSDGVSFYGNVPVGPVGSLDYTAMLGRIESVPNDSLLARTAGGLTIADHYGIPAIYGGSLFWETPVDGLRIGFTDVLLPHVNVADHLATEAFATLPGLTYNATPLLIDRAYGAGTWDHAFAGSPSQSIVTTFDQYISAEYTRGKWIFAAEWKQAPSHLVTNVPALGVVNSYQRERTVASYAMLTYQATKQLGFGVYTGFSDNDSVNATGLPAEYLDQTDHAAVVSYAPVSWWLFKVEFHAMKGLGLVDSAGDPNPNAPTAGSSWDYLVFKTTVTF